LNPVVGHVIRQLFFADNVDITSAGAFFKGETLPTASAAG
jgi:hypothetical protein